MRTRPTTSWTTSRQPWPTSEASVELPPASVLASGCAFWCLRTTQAADHCRAKYVSAKRWFKVVVCSGAHGW